MEAQALERGRASRVLAEPRGNSSYRLGCAAEAQAEAALRRHGMRILERRYRRSVGEIDLIAEHGALLVFVEVKSRRERALTGPADSVTEAKRRRMARTALAFLAERGWLDRPCRFDVVLVFTRAGGGTSRLRHIEDAFRIVEPHRG